MKKIRLLFVEDEDSFRKSVSLELRSKALFDIDECESGEEALESLKNQRYDVILLDHKMGALSGLNVLQWINEQKIDTPVVMLTGAGSETIAVEAMKLGAYDYVRKEDTDYRHLQIVIQGVHERYLFRKEKDYRDRVQKDREKNISSLELLRSSTTFFAHLVNTTLSVVSANLDEIQQDIKPLLPPENQKLLEKACLGVKQEYNLIAVVTKSLVDLSRIMYEKFEGVHDTDEIENDIRAQLKALQERFSASHSE